MVKLTVTLVTKKLEPHFDWALESLRSQNFKDFEYIIVDGYYHKRNDEVRQLIKEMNVNFPVLYIPDKPSRWRGKRSAICNARNTALIFANGQYIVNHDDCCKIPPNWLETHLRWLEKGYIVAGTWVGYESIDKGGKGITGIYGQEYRSTIIKEPKVVRAGWFYGANCSYPLEPVLDINGYDEDLDGELGQEDINLGLRLERRGYKTMFDPLCQVGYYMMVHRYKILIPPINIILRDGKEHFSNEWFMEKFLDDKDRVTPYGNIIDIRNARSITRQCNIEQLYKTMEMWINPDPLDWRDGRLVADKIKEASWEVA